MSAAHPIVVRRPKFTVASETSRYWFGGDPFATHFMNALSSIFPDGEAFFVKSVMHYRDQIEDPDLKKAVQAFAAQEGQHAHQHDTHVDMLLEQGYPGIAWRNNMVRKMTGWSIQYAPKASLAATASLEHLTAIFARRLLTETERWTAPMGEDMGPLWQWHALEEAEHKAVAFDVLQQVAPGQGRRAFALATNTFGLFFDAMDRTIYMLAKDGELWKRSTWASGFHFLFGREGLLRGVGKDYWAWYRKDFHPNDHDDREMIAEWREKIGGGAAESLEAAAGR